MRTIKPIRHILTTLLLIATMAMGHATTVTYTYQGNSTPSHYSGHFIASGDITGNYPATDVEWDANTTSELTFDLADGISLTITNTSGQDIQGTGYLAIRGNSRLSVNSSDYYITNIKVYDIKGRIVQFNENGVQVTSGGVTTFDFYNMEKSYSRDITSSFVFLKVELTYSSTIPLDEAEISGLPTEPILPAELGGINPAPTVTWHGFTLTQDTHYTLSWDNNTEAAIGTVTATGVNSFSGTVSAEYALRAANLDDLTAGDDGAYLIANAIDLRRLASLVNAGNNVEGLTFRQIADIDNVGKFTPIANKEEGTNFNATYDGGGFTIGNVTVGSTGNHVGLFGIGNGATLKNLHLANSSITGMNNVGGIIGTLTNGLITNCRVDNTVTVACSSNNASNHGGIAGNSAGTIQGCYSAAQLTATNGCSNFGGIVGYASGAIMDCLYDGNAFTTASNRGALVGGKNTSVELSNNYYTTASNLNAVGWSSTDIDGARHARSITAGNDIILKISTDDIATYDVSELTAYSDFAIMHNSTLYSGATQNIDIDLNYTGTVGHDFIFMGFTANGDTLSGDSNSYTLTMPDEDVIIDALILPLKPTQLVATNITSSSVTLQWTENGRASQWQICLMSDTVSLITVGKNPHSIGNLTPSTTYSASVRAINGGQMSQWSDTITFTTYKFLEKPEALAVTLTPGNGTIATLRWTECGTATAWQISLNNNITDIIDANTNPFTLTGLTPGNTYNARVRAVEGVNVSAWSAPVTFKPINNYELTIHDSNATDEYIPVYGYFCDAYQKSESIYPAVELAGMTNDTITHLVYYLRTPALRDWTDVDFKVYMREVEQPNFGAAEAFLGFDEDDLVYQGELNATQSTMTIVLDKRYAYHGGNLLIGFYMANVGDYSTAYFSGETVACASVQGYDEFYEEDPDNLVANWHNFLPKTTFKVVPPAYNPGDVNQDGAVDVRDITALVSIILEEEEATSMADINNDGMIDVRDITALINIILEGA